MAIKSPLINVMERAARKAGRGLNRDFGEVEQLQVSPKGTANFASTADTKAQVVLREELSHARPDFGILMEESGETKGRDEEHRWIIHPLDGTFNFLHGIPYFSISVAVERSYSSAGRPKSEIIAGLVYDPVHDDSYWSDKAQGAYLNDRRLRVSARRRLSEALIGTGMAPGTSGRDASDQADGIYPSAALAGRIRALGRSSVQEAQLRSDVVVGAATLRILYRRR